MNPNAYPPPPVQFQQQMPQAPPTMQQFTQQQQAPLPPPPSYQQQQQYGSDAQTESSTGDWAPQQNAVNSQHHHHQQQQQQQQQQQMSQHFSGQPEMVIPPPTATTLNGNYQEQLVASVNNLDINVAKQQAGPGAGPGLPPPVNFGNSNANSNSNGPPVMSNSSHYMPSSINNGSQAVPTSDQQHSSRLTPNNNYFGVKAETERSSSGQQQAPNFLPPPAESTVTAARPPTIAGGVNKMTASSASLRGLPHMPPPLRSATVSPFPPPLMEQNEPSLPDATRTNVYEQQRPPLQQQQHNQSQFHQQQEINYPPAGPNRSQLQSTLQQDAEVKPIQQTGDQYPGMPPTTYFGGQKTGMPIDPQMQQQPGSFQQPGSQKAPMPNATGQQYGLQMPAIPIPNTMGQQYGSQITPMQNTDGQHFGSQKPPIANATGQQHGSQVPPISVHGEQPYGPQKPPMPNTVGQQYGSQKPPMPNARELQYGTQMPPMPNTGAQQFDSKMPSMSTTGQQQYGSQMPPMPNAGGPQYGSQITPTPNTGMPQYGSQMTPTPNAGGPQYNSQLPPIQNSGGQQYGSQMPPMPNLGNQQYGSQIPPQPQPQLQQPTQPPMPGGFPMQGMPPQPGRPNYGQPAPAAGPGGMYQQQPYQQQQQQRRLDPDQMPNPVQVMEDNQATCGGVFVTNDAGLVPPLVTTKFIVQDQGNASPRYIRSSLYSVPCTADILKTTALPFTLNISPLAKIAEGEYEPVIVDFGQLGPIRCSRCKAYMSPNMQFIDAGRRFQCLMCKVATEVPTEYFQHLDHTGQRMDKYERPELVLGTYELLATADYCRNNAACQVPAFVFVIDVSYNAMKSGLVQLICSQMKTILKHFPVDQGEAKSKLRVGFITFDSSVHFYNIKSTLAQPQMMVVGDVQDMFMPLLDGFLCHPEESEIVIDALMEQIPRMFADTKDTETVLYSAMQAGLEALKASSCAGKLYVFNTTLPIAQAPGQLKNREDRKLLGTEKEKTILMPQCTMYNQLGQDFVQCGCSVDLFVFNNSYIDIATIGQVSRLTGGEVYKYTYFQVELDGRRLIEELKKNVTRQIAFDAVMRVRTSSGVRPTDFYGHFFMSNTTDVELAVIDSSKSISIEIKHDDKLVPEENIYVQVALLYTSCGGQRRLRIINLALRATNTISEVFKSCDLDAMMLFFAKQACFKLMDLTPKQVKDNVINRAAQILACYRKHCTSPTSSGQLILPEGLKLLPLYVSCLLKNDAISGGSDMTIDDRSFVIQFVLSMDLNSSVGFLYPRLIPIHDVDPKDDNIPAQTRCSHERMSESGAYILENGIHFFLWLGQSLPPSFIQPLFGVQHTQQVNAERFSITGDTPLARRIKGIIESIMAERTRYMRITCVRQNDKLESVFRHFLVEDRGTDGSVSYVDFLCHLHKEIKEILS